MCSATFQSSTKANGGRAVLNMLSPNSSISKNTDMDPSILSTTIFCSNRNASRRFATASDAKLSIQWGIEGRVDSVAQHLFPAMAKAHCRTVMFGIESGSQKILDRLKKEQTLEEVATAVKNAKNAGIEIVHGFFTVGNPDETVEDLKATFDFAAKLPLDTFGFNRLCVYRGTPLWQEYVKRGLVSDTTDWYKYFKCSDDRSDLLAWGSDQWPPPSRVKRCLSTRSCTIPSRPSVCCAGFSVSCR